MKVEVAVLGPVPNKSTVSVDVKQHFNNYNRADKNLYDPSRKRRGAQELPVRVD